MRYLLSESSAAILRAIGADRGGVSFADRRIAPPGALMAGGWQWRISAAAVEGGDGAVLVSVGPGLVAWGAGINYSHPGEEGLGPLESGSSARVVWLTAAPPLPLVYDPRWPTGNAPKCSDRECDCPEREGDPDGTGGDSGALLLVPLDWTAPNGTTDVRDIGVVSVSDAGGVSIRQLQRDTIVARAIVGRVPGGGDPEEETPTCGNPLNDSSDYNPLDHVPIASGDRNPLDDPGPGGYTPTCRDEKAQAA